MDEFELIARCFRDPTVRRRGTVLGIGDDAAVLDTGGGRLVHARGSAAYRADTDPAGLARRVFGATFIRLATRSTAPRWATLGLTLDASGSAWIEHFAGAAAAVCDACGVELVGGDTTRGPGRATVFALGVERTGSRRPTPPRPTAAASVRLPLGTAGTPGRAIADLVSACVALAGGGATILCEFGTDVDDGDRLLALVAYTDAAGLGLLRAALDPWDPAAIAVTKHG